MKPSFAFEIFSESHPCVGGAFPSTVDTLTLNGGGVGVSGEVLGVFASIETGTKMPNKAVEVNGRGGVCRSFHVVSFISGVASWRCPPVPHLLLSGLWIVRVGDSGLARLVFR